ncbi:unnamed protein product [Caenorhabditis brenneri]
MTTDPKEIDLMKFLIEKTRDAKSPLNMTQLAEEYKETSGSSRKLFHLRMRIYAYRSRIHQMDTIDTKTKVKMMFGLGAPIDMDFLNELQKDAHVEVDEKSRITKYKANDGSLELEGDHSQPAKKKTPPSNLDDPKEIDLINFLIEKTKDAKSTLNIMQLAEKYKRTSGSSRKLFYLRMRIGHFRSRIHQMDTIDTETKVKLIFGLSASIDENFLNELRKNAHVEVDEKNRIIKYKAKDGSLEMEGHHNGSAKTPGSTKRSAAAEESISFKKIRDSSSADIEDPKSSTASGIQQLQQPKLEESPELEEIQ